MGSFQESTVVHVGCTDRQRRIWKHQRVSAHLLVPMQEPMTLMTTAGLMTKGEDPRLVVDHSDSACYDAVGVGFPYQECLGWCSCVVVACDTVDLVAVEFRACSAVDACT